MGPDTFTPASALIGGIMIGLSTAAVMWSHGRIGGCSGILHGLFRLRSRDTLWRFLFLAGMVAGGALVFRAYPPSNQMELVGGTPTLIAAGLLAGIGTRLAHGCTSGHGVCGISRLSRRSIAATLTFMAFGVIAACLAGLVRGAS